MSSHNAVVTTAVRAPLSILKVPTVQPIDREVLVHVEWTASTPLELHQADGGLLVKHPYVMGSNPAGTVVKVGPKVQNLVVGDKVFGFAFREQKEKAHQEFATIPEYLLGKLCEGFTLQQVVTTTGNAVTVFHTVTADLSLPLIWPRNPAPEPLHANAPILIWGGASSCGQYALQILSHWGYRNLLTTASPSNHSYLRSLGAAQVFDYRDPRVANLILEAAAMFQGQKEKEGGQDGPTVPFVLDCIGSKAGSLVHIAKIAQKGTRVAVLLPVILKDATDEEAPEYTFDVDSSAQWAEGVETRGTRTHFYMEKNEFFKEHLQSTIIPQLLAEGVIKPNKQKIVEGETLLERAQNALNMLRKKEASAERLVWRVSDQAINEHGTL